MTEGEAHIQSSWRRMAAAVAWLAAVCIAGQAIAADVLQVPRYDDADEYLPAAERRNKNNVRLLLRQQDGEELFKVLTPRNVTVDVIARVPPDATAAVVLLIGGTGVLSIVNDKLDRSFSLQPRSRDGWWARQFATFLVDAPSDRLGKDGIQDPVWRAGAQHNADLQAVIDVIGKRFSGPLVIYGHSNGAISLANLARLQHPAVKAYAFSSPAHFRVGTLLPTEVEYKAPVLVLQHRRDVCAPSPSSEAEGFVRALKTGTRQLLWLDGGSDPLSGACGPFSPHSFFGIEKQAMDTLATELRKVMR